MKITELLRKYGDYKFVFRVDGYKEIFNLGDVFECKATEYNCEISTIIGKVMVVTILK